MEVSIGYRLSSLGMGPCAWRGGLGAIMGHGAGTSIVVRVRVRVRRFGSRVRHAHRYFRRHGMEVSIGYR
jgi:hypothetical protein